MKILSLLDEIVHVYQIMIASGSAPSLRQWFRTLLEASIFSMYANTVINIHVGTDGDINVDTDALVERVFTAFLGFRIPKSRKKPQKRVVFANLGPKSMKTRCFPPIFTQNRRMYRVFVASTSRRLVFYAHGC